MDNMPKYMDNISTDIYIYIYIMRINTMKYMDNTNILIYRYNKLYGHIWVIPIMIIIMIIIIIYIYIYT